jgi:hypothetical protein
MADWREQGNRLHAAGYLRQFSHMAMNMCVPFWWTSGPRGGPQVRQNGTLCYVDTGTRRIGITATTRAKSAGGYWDMCFRNEGALDR